MLKSETETIGDHQYTVTQLGFSAGQKLLVRLYKVLGPAAGRFFAELPEDLKVKDIGDAKVVRFLPSVGAVMAELADRISESDLQHVTKVLAANTTVRQDGGEVQLDKIMELHFAGDHAAFFKWMWFALKVNYSGFFGGPGALGSLIAKVAERESQSPATSIGTSTESSQAGDTTKPSAT